ncbi:toprim domain-containing protein [Legionella feeleii]|uniref:toprim domain-containing protein n=1 Tax=Legionella feeleii TaxID=453 RepID=UPI0007D070A4|nr:toprim domain-containing protein [Legionella feeleii]
MTGTADTAPKVNKIQTNYTPLDYQEVVFRANQYGWPSIVAHFNTPSDCLTGKKSICPLCHEKKFRFVIKPDGSCRYICICTGSKYRDGFSLIAEINSIDNKAAFKAVSEFLGLNNKTTRSEVELNKNIEAYKKRQEEAEQKRQDKIVSDKDTGEAHAKAVLANCEMGEHQDFTSKGYKHEVLINKKLYKITYQRVNDKGIVENKTQTVPIGAAILPIHDIDNPKRIISFQFISPHIDPRTGKHPKLMLVDSVTAGFCIIRGDNSLPYASVTEGYRTGLAINCSLGCTAVVLFDANGIKSRTQRVKELFPNKEILICGDNDERKGGQKAAHTAAFHTKSKAIIPLKSGTDWDDYRQEYGEESLRAEVNRQITELSFKPVEIKSSITGISANHSILLLASGEGVSFADALINYSGKQCICPVSGEKAIINAGSIYCYETRQIITPIIASLYDVELIAKYKKLTSTQKRIKELSDNSDPKNVYAFTTAVSHRIGADIPSSRFKDWLYLKGRVAAPEEIINFIQCLSRARINQSKGLIALDTKRFKNRVHLKQKNGLLDWLHGVEKAKNGEFKIVAVKAHHGQGKSKDFMKQMFNHALGVGGAVAIAHRRKLVTQLADVLECIHYQDDRDYISYAGGVKNLACCLHSFKHEKFLNHLVNSHSIFIDEASQALKAFYTDSNIEKGLAKKFSESAKNAQCVYLLDADLTENDIKRWASLLGVNEDEILVITAEPPVRDLTVNLTCTASLKYFKTSRLLASSR